MIFKMVIGNIISPTENSLTMQSLKTANEKVNGNTSIPNKNPINAETSKTIKKKVFGELGMNRVL